jgi:hypothetical protein
MNIEERDEICQAFGVMWPDGHPETGEAFTGCTMRTDRDVRTIRYLPPVRPDREIWDYPDCEYCGEAVLVRVMTDDEYAEALENWCKRLDEYRRTNGTARVAGQMTTLAKFACDSGSTADGIWAGDKWHWKAWEIAG